MKLIFINPVGMNFKGNSIYELIFSSDDIKNISGEDWDAYPANGNPKIPSDHINAVYNFETELSLELIQNSVSFDMDDCKQGIIALAWEAEKDEYEYDSRLFFKFGEKFDTVKSKLYERDIFIEKTYEKIEQPID